MLPVVVMLRGVILPVAVSVALIPTAEMSLPEFVEQKTPVFDQETIPDWKRSLAVESFDFAQMDSTAAYLHFDNPPKK